MPTSPPREVGGDRGFTLVELLIVIVILGILATVTVFAVRSIRDQGAESACATDFRQLTTGVEAHRALHGTYADEADMVALDTLTEASERFDVTGDAAGYSIAPAAGSECTQSDAGGGAGGGPLVPPPAVMPGASFNWHGGVTAWRYPNDGAGNDEIVVLGRGWGEADWVATNDAGTATARRMHFVELDGMTRAELDTLIGQITNNGVTALAIYPADDTTQLPGAAEPNVADYLATVLPGEPAITYYELTFGGFDLRDVIAITG